MNANTTTTTRSGFEDLLSVVVLVFNVEVDFFWIVFGWLAGKKTRRNECKSMSVTV